jgi:multicomponent Na+:H+ antiporter subunit A
MNTPARAGRAGMIFTILPLLALLVFLWLAAEGENRVVRFWSGAEALGFVLSVRLDGLSILFGVLISAVGVLVFIYAGHYLAGRRGLVGFYSWLSLFMVAMIGVVTAENLIALFIFWELTSISSWILIGNDHERESARSAALQALLVTAGGGMAMLAGFLMLGSVAGSFELTAIAAQEESIRASGAYLPILFLIAAGGFTKSAQVPFHFWLPAAMEAPTPVSAYLHSATMVKAGVFLLARFLPVLGGTAAWFALLGIAGALTMLTGAVMAVIATDIKRILAYSTISALGSLVFLLGIGSPAAVQAAMVFLLAHALYKAALFMVGGIIDHETGTRDVEHLSGLRRTMPLTAVTAIMAAISLAAFGPVLSFAGKEMVILALSGTPVPALWLKLLVYAVSALLAGAAALVAIKPFFGAVTLPAGAHDPAPGLWLPPLLLASAGVGLGLFPYGLTRFLLAPAAVAAHPDARAMHIEVWHGVNIPLIMSAVALAAGLILFRSRTAWMRIGRPLGALARFGPSAIWHSLLGGSLSFAGWQTRRLQNGSLRFYLLVVILTLIALVSIATIATEPLRFNFAVHDARFHELFISALIVAGALMAVRSQSRLGSVAALGVVGYSVALMYILFSGPDLAMTQFLIETLTVILFVLVIYRLPRYAVLTPPRERTRDAVICAIAGALVSVLVLAAASETAEPVLSHYYAANSVGRAHGRNIVNVILVDFRALDTFGEITVLGVAAVGVMALLRLRAEREHT